MLLQMKVTIKKLSTKLSDFFTTKMRRIFLGLYINNFLNGFSTGHSEIFIKNHLG